MGIATKPGCLQRGADGQETGWQLRDRELLSQVHSWQPLVMVSPGCRGGTTVRPSQGRWGGSAAEPAAEGRQRAPLDSTGPLQARGGRRGGPHACPLRLQGSTGRGLSQRGHRAAGTSREKLPRGVQVPLGSPALALPTQTTAQCQPCQGLRWPRRTSGYTHLHWLSRGAQAPWGKRGRSQPSATAEPWDTGSRAGQGAGTHWSSRRARRAPGRC